jgi:hypothetical protein
VGTIDPNGLGDGHVVARLAYLVGMIGMLPLVLGDHLCLVHSSGEEKQQKLKDHE